MELHRNGSLFGILTDYEYETPWAIARITPVDADVYRRFCRASAIDGRISELLGEDDDDAAYERLLEAHGITEEDVRGFGSQWTIVNPGSSLSGGIDLAECGSDGWVRWRWL